jgi:hypothetical protein
MLAHTGLLRLWMALQLQLTPMQTGQLYKG